MGRQSSPAKTRVDTAPGKLQVVVDFTPNPGTPTSAFLAGRLPVAGAAKLFVNGKAAGEAKIAALATPYVETLDVGRDLGSAVSKEYTSPFQFTGKIDEVKVDLE